MSKHHHKHVAPGSTGAAQTQSQSLVTHRNERHNDHPVSADEIRLAAYRKWENAGKPAGDGLLFWLEAEDELSILNRGNH